MKSALVVGVGAFAYGLERRAVNALKNMHQVRPYFLISKYEDGSVSSLLTKNGFSFERVPFGYLGWAKPLWTLITLSQLPWLYFRFFQAYLRHDCNIILVLSLQPFKNAALPIILLKYIWRSRIVLYLGDIPGDHWSDRLTAKLSKVLSERVIANSQAVKAGLSKIGLNGDNVRVVYNGVNPHEWERSESMQLRSKYSIPPSSYLVGYIGQFAENKGIWDFIEAAKIIRQRMKNCRFVLIGKSDGLNRVQHEVCRHIQNNGLKNHMITTGKIEHMEQVYADLDIVVVPSRYDDPAPNVIIEAMASGTPLVGTRAGGIPELMAEGETGLLVDKGEPGQIAACICDLLKDAELRKKMGAAGQERVRRLFDIERNASKVEEIVLDG